jgi:hypothetical protein
MEERDRLVHIKEGARDRLLGMPGVTGLDVDFKTTGGRHTDRLAIVVYVARKRDVPVPIPATIDGVPTDVVEASFSLKTDRGRYNPVRCGTSCYPRRFSNDYGTLGCVVIDNTTGLPCFLSCWHVLCITRDWRQNDVTITQPALNLGGSALTDAVGQVVRGAFLGVDGVTASVDCAICVAGTRSGTVPRTSRPTSGYIEALNIGTHFRLRGMTNAFVGQAVAKCGATTSRTRGTVASTNFDVTIGPQTWLNQIKVTASAAPIVDNGDSGSVFYEESSKKAVGLFWSSDGPGTFAVAQPIQLVCNTLNITIPTSYPAWFIEGEIDDIVLEAANVAPRGPTFYPAPIKTTAPNLTQAWDVGGGDTQNIGMGQCIGIDPIDPFGPPFLTVDHDIWRYMSAAANTTLEFVLHRRASGPDELIVGRLRGVYDRSTPPSQWRAEYVPKPDSPQPGDTWDFRFHSWIPLPLEPEDSE